MSGKTTGDAFLIDLACEVIRILTGKGVKNAAALLITKEIVTAVTQQCGGQLIYISKAKTSEYVNKATGIYADFDGRNHKQLAEKYGVGLDYVYKVIRRGKPKKITMVSRSVDAATVANLIDGIGDQA